MVKVCVIFFSTSRYEYLFPMLEAFDKFVDFHGVEVYKIFIDDYPRTRDQVLLDYISKTYSIDHMVLNDENIGYSKSWNKAWSLVPDDIDYIWHQEDDLVILRYISVMSMIKILQFSPTPLHQIFLKRQICYDSNDFVSKIEGETGDEYEIEGHPYFTANLQWFISHSGLYPAWISKLNYQYNPQEGIILPVIHSIIPESRAAIIGNRRDKNRIEHIGEYNHGMKCIEGEPGYESFGQYDKDKEYYSMGWLKLWKGSRNYQMAQLHIKYGTPEKVIEYYKKCIDEDADEHIRYNAAIKLGSLCDTSYYIKATRISPTRLEAWYELMMINKEFKHVSYGYGRQGYEHYKTGIRPPNGQYNAELYDYRFIFEYCMVCYYSGNLDMIEDISAHIKKETVPGSIYEQHERNKTFYKNPIKFRELPYKTPSVIIIDNFLPDPMKEREFALAQDFMVNGNYPGTRTKSFSTEDDKHMFETILGKKITLWRNDQYNGSYQYCTKDMKSWIHRDMNTCSAMLYLSPDAPLNGGTITYVHEQTKKTLEKDNVDGIFDRDSQNYDAWDVCDVIANKFNRLVIFQGIHSHQSAKYFGDNLENGRLFKVFFFNVGDGLDTV